MIGASGQEAVGLLAGAEPADESLFAAANKGTAEVIEHLGRGGSEWLKSVTEFQSPAPLDRLRNFWATMLHDKGALKGFQIVGTTAARGGRTQTLVRFDLERGAEYWLLLWQGVNCADGTSTSRRPARRDSCPRR